MHKWLALLIGAQLLIWFASGALMSLLPIEQVRGEHLVKRGQSAPLPNGLSLAQLRVAGASSVEIVMIAGRPVARMREGEQTTLADVETGRKRGPITGNEAEAIVAAAWKGAPVPKFAAELIGSPGAEYRGETPVWRVRLGDPGNTRVYVEPSTGRLAAVRTGTWRLYDFVWGLHIMDWKNHEDFNTPWLQAFALLGLILGLAGASHQHAHRDDLAVRGPQSPPQRIGLRVVSPPGVRHRLE